MATPTVTEFVEALALVGPAAQASTAVIAAKARCDLLAAQAAAEGTDAADAVAQALTSNEALLVAIGNGAIAEALKGIASLDELGALDAIRTGATSSWVAMFTGGE